MKIGTVRVRNVGQSGTELSLEPEGATFPLGPNGEKTFQLDGPVPMDLVVEVDSGKVTVFVWRGVAVEDLDDPEEFRQKHPAPRVP